MDTSRLEALLEQLIDKQDELMGRIENENLLWNINFRTLIKTSTSSTLDQGAGRNAALGGNGETRIDDLVDLRKALEVLPHQRQSGVRRQVVGQALDLKVGHGDGGGGKAVIISNARRLHPPGEQKNAGNSCQARVLAVRVTDSGNI